MRLFEPKDIFTRRILISVHPWAAGIFTVGVMAAIVTRLNDVTNAIGIASALTAFGVVLISRRQVATLRAEVRRATVIMDDDEQPLDHEIPTTKIDHANDVDYLRIHGH